MSLRTSDRRHWRGNPFSRCHAAYYTLPMGTRIPTPVCAPARNDRRGGCCYRVRLRGASVRVDVGIDPYENGTVSAIPKIKYRPPFRVLGILVGDGGFEPPKALPADLQSVPFGHSGNPPYRYGIGAGGRIRTPDLLITNQLLYQLSYTSISPADRIIAESNAVVNKKVTKSEKIYRFKAIQLRQTPKNRGRKGRLHMKLSEMSVYYEESGR